MPPAFAQRRQWLDLVSQANSANPAAVIQDLRAQIADSKKRLEGIQRSQSAGAEGDLMASAKSHSGLRWIAAELNLGAAATKDLVFSLTKAHPDLVVLLVFSEDDKVQAHLGAGETAVTTVHAGNWLRELGHHIEGGGGGQAFYASAGGKKPSGIPNLLKAFEQKWQSIP